MRIPGAENSVLSPVQCGNARSGTPRIVDFKLLRCPGLLSEFCRFHVQLCLADRLPLLRALGRRRDGNGERRRDAVSWATEQTPSGSPRPRVFGEARRRGQTRVECLVDHQGWSHSRVGGVRRTSTGGRETRFYEVVALSLHGSYHEKIVTLGDSLFNFKRLKSLDLSRNAIVSLEGLECLQELEKLSLYFNNIQTLKEISSLRHLIHLTELDLRLNPVTTTEENYRQYVIRLLPNLMKLDLRPVRAAERNPAKFAFISQEQYQTSEVDKRQERSGNSSILIIYIYRRI
ncbi:centrosomal protein of 72 kDa-like [Mobula hypostoma]|uniref:centrosomal protein of 72 kDa-like n=1 Tax=Mobula hypostoma TaxID=723540 RepID=UPI002FC2B45E